MSSMKTIGYARVSTDKQADRGVSLEAQAEKIRAMAVVHNAELIDIIVDGGESAKSLNRPGMARLLALVDAGEVKAVIIAKLDRLTRSVKDLCTLLERFERRGVALVSVAESLDTGSAAGRLVLNIMTAVSQWEREAIGERTRDVLRHKRSQGERVGNIAYGFRLAADGQQGHRAAAPVAGHGGGRPAAALGGGLGESLHLALQLGVDGLQLLIERLHLFLGGFQLLVGALQFFVGGLQFFVAGFEFLVLGLQFLHGVLQRFPGEKKFMFQVLHLVRRRLGGG